MQEGDSAFTHWRPHPEYQVQPHPGLEGMAEATYGLALEAYRGLPPHLHQEGKDAVDWSKVAASRTREGYPGLAGEGHNEASKAWAKVAVKIKDPAEREKPMDLMDRHADLADRHESMSHRGVFESHRDHAEAAVAKLARSWEMLRPSEVGALLDATPKKDWDSLHSIIREQRPDLDGIATTARYSRLRDAREALAGGAGSRWDEVKRSYAARLGREAKIASTEADRLTADAPEGDADAHRRARDGHEKAAGLHLEAHAAYVDCAGPGQLWREVGMKSHQKELDRHMTQMTRHAEAQHRALRAREPGAFDRGSMTIVGLSEGHPAAKALRALHAYGDIQPHSETACRMSAQADAGLVSHDNAAEAHAIAAGWGEVELEKKVENGLLDHDGLGELEALNQAHRKAQRYHDDLAGPGKLTREEERDFVNRFAERGITALYGGGRDSKGHGWWMGKTSPEIAKAAMGGELMGGDHKVVQEAKVQGLWAPLVDPRNRSGNPNFYYHRDAVRELLGEKD
jgi:hypothetical protein